MFGQQLSSFRVESWLGAGSLAIVYRGVDERTGERVAIKVARQGCESAPHRLIHSCEILDRLDHENIVRVREVGCHEGTYYLVMEFIPGPTVADLCAERRALPWREVVGLGLQICAALQHIHRRGVLHRNLKPSHLIRSADGQLKLVGFGLAKSLDETNFGKEGMAVGTPGYMAPEQICGIRAIDHRTDLYSLGVVLWNMLTGESPYQEPGESGHRRGGAALAFAHLTQPVPRPSERIHPIPEALDDLVAQLMGRAPDGRPRDAAAVASVLLTLSN
jgi:eukaryotic-like serine/threonine-protein kinase